MSLALACHWPWTWAASRCRRCSCSSVACSRPFSADAARLAGSLDGEGGARKVDVRGLGALDLAGE